MIETAESAPSAGRVATWATFFVLALLWCFLGARVLADLYLSDHPRWALLATELAGILLPALVAGSFFATRLRLRPRRVSWARAIGGSTLVAATCLPVAFGGQVLWLHAMATQGWAWVQHWTRVLEEAQAGLLHVDGPFEAVVVVALVALAPAACEEVAFRGVLQGVLARRFSPAVAIGVTSVVFASFHDPLGLPVRLFLGVALGIAYHATGSLLACGIVHAIYNGVTVAVLIGHSGKSPEVAVPVAAVLLVVGAVAWILATRLLRAPAAERAA